MLRMMNLLKKKSRRLNRTKRMKRNRKMKNKKRTNKFQMKRNSIRKMRKEKEINNRQVVAKGVMKVIEITHSNLECTTKKDKEGAMEEVIRETTSVEDTEEITDHLEEEITDSKDVTKKMINKRIKLSGLVEEQEEEVVNSIEEEVEVMKERT